MWHQVRAAGGEFQYGGQAVIEGVMMRGQDLLAVAVRKPSNEIIVDRRRLVSVSKRWPILKWPILRGMVALVESLVFGIQALMFSANQFTGEEEKLTATELSITMGVAILMFVGLFIVVPNLFAVYIQRTISKAVIVNLAEGFFRIFIFLGYILSVSKIKDIRRVFEYHGAEHKVIHAYEAGEELNVENAKKHCPVHPRCGTSFLLIVMVVMILIFSLLGRRTLLVRIITRLILLPFIAGISYEAIKASGKKKVQRYFKWLMAPGLWLQRLTTREPDDGQLEVAIKALEGVLEA